MQARPRTALRRVMQLLFVVAALAILAAPMVVQFALRSEPRRGENRAPAALPAWPGSLAGVAGWSAGVVGMSMGMAGVYADAPGALRPSAFSDT